MSRRKVGIILKKASQEAAQMGDDLIHWLDRKNIEATVDSVTADLDLLIILGGDGTLLHVADQASQFEVPVVGVNLGDLGFLTEIAVGERYDVLESILAGEVTIEERIMLRARLHEEETPTEWRVALNDVVVSKGSIDQLVRLATWADKELITSYRADGLIFSTPTGSTAYNLSAGGPIVHPLMSSILVTPVCPFMLESRPVLLPSGTTLTTRLVKPVKDVKVIVDGQFAWKMNEHDFLEVRVSPKPLRLVCSPEKGYFQILRNKLNWGGGSSAGTRE